MALPDGWELGPDGLPRRVKKRRGRHGQQVFDLSGLEIDEVSFVERGANQRAHIVLSKADQERTMPTDEAVWAAIQKANDDLGLTADPYGDSAVRYSDARELVKAYEARPELYDATHTREVHTEVARSKSVADRLAALQAAGRGDQVAATYDATYGRQRGSWYPDGYQTHGWSG
jgi:hypothetical protein